MAKTQQPKRPAQNAPQAEWDAYRVAIKAMIEGNDADLAAIPDYKSESDPYIQAQLAALRRMIDESRDPETGIPKKQGVIEFLFEVMNESGHPVDARMKAATTLISFFHKKVPSALVVTNNTNLADVDLSGLSDTELAHITALLDKATIASVESKSVAIAQHLKH